MSSISLAFALWAGLAAAAPGDDLYAAVSGEDLQRVQAALAAGADPQWVHAYTHHPGMVGRFFGQRTETRTDTPYELALRQVAGGSTKAEPILVALIGAGAPLERGARELLGYRGAEPELSPGKRRAIEVLATAGLAPEAWLCLAARAGDAGALKWALAAGAPLSTDCGGESALAGAVGRGHEASALVLLDAGASRADLRAGRTLFDGASPSINAALLAHPRPMDARERAALLAAWAEGALSESQVGGLLPPEITLVLAQGMYRADGAAGVIAAADAIGMAGLVALAAGPVGALWQGQDPQLRCNLAFGQSPRAAGAALGVGAVAQRSGPLQVWTHPAGEAAYVRPFPGLPVGLWMASLPADCDPVAGALVGQPRSVVRLALGPPVLVWPDRDLWRPGTRAHDRGRHEAWLVVRYEADAALAPALDWRQP